MKILIADDESLVRQSILMFLHDLGIDYDDVVEASNGISMLEAVRVNHFDLALIDIRMPSMDGLEAIRQAKALAPYTDYYILTGFDDFQYAREGIRLGVRDYILKPLKRTVLEEILEHTISSMEQKKARLMDTLTLCIMSLFSSHSEAVRFPLPCRPVLIANDVPDEPFSSSELLAKDDGKIIVIPSKQPEGTFLFLFELPEHPQYSHTYVEQLSSRYSTICTVVEGRLIQDNQTWQGEQERITSIASCRFLFGGHRLYKNSVKSPMLTAAQTTVCLQCEHGMAAYASGDYVGFSLACEALLTFLQTAKDTCPTAAETLKNYIIQAYHLKPASLPSLRSQLMQLSATMNLNRNKDFRYQEILQYIQEHFQEDLSLSDVAAAFGFSPNYFSSLFKKKTGRNFTHYLTDLRIRQAKGLLLDTSMTVREISSAVGYYSTSFFIRSFKNSEGITPLEYRKIHEKG